MECLLQLKISSVTLLSIQTKEALPRSHDQRIASVWLDEARKENLGRDHSSTSPEAPQEK